jgi:exodeoxyribonuclease VII small subunit
MPEKKSFGKQFQELEKLVEEFEDGKIDLEESIGKFEAALTLANDLQKRLKDVENKVEVIKKKFKDVEE